MRRIETKTDTQTHRQTDTHTHTHTSTYTHTLTHFLTHIHLNSSERQVYLKAGGPFFLVGVVLEIEFLIVLTGSW